jgi:hypothetical protein
MIRTRITARAQLGKLRDSDVCLFDSLEGETVAIAYGGRVRLAWKPNESETFDSLARSMDLWWSYQAAAPDVCDPNAIPAHVLLVVFRDHVFHVIEDSRSPGDSVLPNRLSGFLRELHFALADRDSELA